MPDPTPDLPLVTIIPDGSYGTELRQKCITALGENGAWLVTSLLHYGWRAHYDLVHCLAAKASWEDDDGDPLGPRDDEYQIVRDLEVQGHMYATAEQLASLVESIDAHEEGGDFFEVYVARRDLRQRVDAVRDVSRARVAALLGAPTSPDALREDLEARRLMPASTPVLMHLDPLSMPTTEVGGLLIPQSTMDRAVIERLWDRVNDMIDGIHRNLGELSAFVDRPPSPLGGMRPQALREVDNSFRHGLRVLFHRAVPNERTFRALEIGEGAGTHLVDLYLPRKNEDVRFATVACSPERTISHLESTRMLCLRIGQVVRGFLGRVVFGNGSLLVGSASLTLGGRSDEQSPPQNPGAA